MAKQKFIVQGDLALDISSFLKDIAKARGALKGMDGAEIRKLHSLFAELSAEMKTYEVAAKRTFTNTGEIKRTTKSYEQLEERIKQIGILLDSTDFGMKSFKLDKAFSKGQKALEGFEIETRKTKHSFEALQRQLKGRFQTYIDTEELTRAAAAGKELSTQLKTLKAQTTIALKVDSQTYNESKQKLEELISTKDNLEKELSKARESLKLIDARQDDRKYDGETKTEAQERQKTAIKDLTQAHRKASEELSKVEKEYTSIIEKFEEGQRLPDIIEKINAAYESLKTTSQEFDVSAVFGEHIAEAFGHGEQGVQALKAILEDLANKRIPEKLTEQVDTLKGSTGGLREEIDGIAEKTSIWEQQAQDILDVDKQVQALQRSMLQFFTVTSGWNMLRKAMREAYKTVKDLDSAMTEIAVVSEYTLDQVWEMRRGYSDAATEMGAKTVDLIDATKLYVQQGLSLVEAQEIGIETIKMARIANLDGAEATTLMTAAVRGFHMELQEANRVNDVYSNLAAKSAADTKEIATAISKTASIAHSAGSEFESMSAFLTQIIETTREAAETAGTAMKTIIARFQELKKPMDEIGEIDGEIVDANAIETALRSAGVALRDVNGEFRDFDDVILELSEKWDDLDLMTQRYIATMAAGSRLNERITDYKSCELRESA